MQTAVEWKLIALLWERPRQHEPAQVGCLSSQIDDLFLKETGDLGCEATQEAYLKHFGPDGPVFLQETAYVICHSEKILRQIETIYDAFSFQSHAENPSDHIAVEADFISHLYVKEARARLANDADAYSVAIDVRTKFIEEHFRILVQALRKKISGSEPEYILKLLVATLHRLQDDSIHASSVPTFEKETRYSNQECEV